MASSSGSSLPCFTLSLRQDAPGRAPALTSHAARPGSSRPLRPDLADVAETRLARAGHRARRRRRPCRGVGGKRKRKGEEGGNNGPPSEVGRRERDGRGRVEPCPWGGTAAAGPGRSDFVERPRCSDHRCRDSRQHSPTAHPTLKPAGSPTPSDNGGRAPDLSPPGESLPFCPLGPRGPLGLQGRGGGAPTLGWRLLQPTLTKGDDHDHSPVTVSSSLYS